MSNSAVRGYRDVSITVVSMSYMSLMSFITVV